jgi:hypothetical protein
VDKKIPADRAKFAEQKATQRASAMQAIRESRVQAFLGALRKDAKIEDKRKKIQASLRRQAS